MIRLMSADDYEQVLALWKCAGTLGLRGLDDSREGITMFLRRNPTTNFVAVEGGQIVGTILCGNDGRRGYIYHTIVRQDYRRQGIATKMIQNAVNALKKEGITRVCLNVLKSNEEGEKFWIEQGWERKDFLGFYSKSISERANEPLFKM